MKELLTTRQVATQTGWAIEKVRRLIDAGKLPAINTSTGRRPRWAVWGEDLNKFLTPAGRSEVSSDE